MAVGDKDADVEKAPLLPAAKAGPVEEEDFVMFGINITLKGAWRFAFLSAGSIFCAIGFAALQEGVFRIAGFHYGGWMTFVTSLCFALCGAVELLHMGELRIRRGGMTDYVLLSTLTAGGMYLTNWSLNYLNYPTRVVAKSSKLIPTMVFGVIIQKKSYSKGDYAVATFLVAGIALFTLGDVDGFPNFNPLGIFLIITALCVDSVCSNFEEKRFFRIATPCSQAEVMLYASLLGAFITLAVLAVTGELVEAFAHSMEHVQVIPYIAAFSVMGYASVTFVLVLIRYYGATETEIIKSTRKVVTILISFMIYPKPINWKYLLGGLMVIVSLVITVQMTKNKPRKGGHGHGHAHGHAHGHDAGKKPVQDA